MEKILVVGSLNMDMVTRVERTPNIGETISGKGLVHIPGGKGANQAVAMGKLGADVEMIGLVGRDGNGEALKKNLEKMNVKNSRVKVHDIKATGAALIMVNESGDNSIVVIPGANGELKAKDVKAEWFEGVSIVVCQLEIPVETVLQVLKMAKTLGIKTVLNPAPAKVLTEELLSKVDLLIPNESEFQLLTGVSLKSKEDFVKGYKILNKIGVNEIIVTLGANGAWYYDGHRSIDVSAKKVEVVDTTAAGDSFIAGVCVALSVGEPIEEALKLGTKVAAITVTRFGAQSSLPTLEEIDQIRK